MEHKYYLPKDDLGKVDWLNNFYTQLVIYATLLGIAPTTVSSVEGDLNFFSYLVGLVTSFKEYTKSLVSYKVDIRDNEDSAVGAIPAAPTVSIIPPAVAPGIFDRIADLVQVIKKHPDYTETIGEALGIIGAEIDNDFGTIQPHPKVSLKNGHAYVQWAHNHTDAADVYADYGDGAGFVYVARILKAHYLDPHLPAAGQSKVYKFMLRYVVNDELVGVESDPVSITVTGPTTP